MDASTDRSGTPRFFMQSRYRENGILLFSFTAIVHGEMPEFEIARTTLLLRRASRAVSTTATTDVIAETALNVWSVENPFTNASGAIHISNVSDGRPGL